MEAEKYTGACRDRMRVTSCQVHLRPDARTHMAQFGAFKSRRFWVERPFDFYISTVFVFLGCFFF